MFANLAVCNDDFQNVLLEFFKPPSVKKSSKILKFNKAKEDFLSPKITRKSNPKGRVLYLFFRPRKMLHPLLDKLSVRLMLCAYSFTI